jgi:NADH:ubiquinone oxidoreductase subunit
MFKKLLGKIAKFRDPEIGERKFVGTDQFKSMYYEIFDNEGVSVKREVVYSGQPSDENAPSPWENQEMKLEYEWMEWLNRRRDAPVGQEELQKQRAEQIRHRVMAERYEEEDKKMMEQVRKQKGKEFFRK